MPPITIDQLKATNLGYLTGADLVRWCAPAHLIRQYNVDPDCFLDGAGTACIEVSRNLSNRYDITDELKKTGVIQALASAVLAGGVITGINMINNGIGYTAVPAIAINDPDGAGAAGTATLSGGTVNNIAVTAGGAGYTAPVVVITGGLGADLREQVLVKVTAIWAIRNILGNFENISQALANNFAWADRTVKDIREGQMNLSLDAAACLQASVAQLIPQRFSTIG